tara:strand:- start:4748 stop:4984 length:237 start_codon:yes stop_codon:yes gene_type:complete
MNYLTHLKKNEQSEDNRWIVKYNKEGFVKEVKLIYNPVEYYKLNMHKGKNARPLHNKNVLIKILENDKTRRNTKMEKI